MVSDTIAGSGLSAEYNSVFDGIPGFETDTNSEVIQIAERLCGRESGTVSFGTEGPYLNAMGMDTVVLGPGDIDQAHQANEFIALDQVKAGTAFIRRLIERLSQ